MLPRLKRLRELMIREDVEALWITHLKNCRYLSGFTGDRGELLITQEEQFLLTDGRFTQQASREAPHFTLVELGVEPWRQRMELLASLKIRQLSFEGEHLSYACYQDLIQHKESFNLPLEVKPCRRMVERLREQKEPGEVENIEKALRIAEEGFGYIAERLQPGWRERDGALELEYFLGKRGSEGPAFPTIVASGPRSALPHGVASDRVLQPGDVVVLDFGATYGGYCSDFTRTLALGPVDPLWFKIHALVREAQEKAIDHIRAGIKAQEVDRVAREHLCRAGYGEYFVHGLGHGVGMEIHESPSLSPKSAEELQPGMVITVEPGVYLPGKGGVRLEDMVLVQEGGAEVLTRAPRELVIL
ncbi:MAG TPA: aminopeptidase P family protein [Moorella mulderi]|nr:aminopeptidase P family protein [Moorella mulderi]